MAKKPTPQPEATAPASITVQLSTGQTVQTTQIESPTAPQGTEGGPMPSTMGNEGPAAPAGEGQPSPATETPPTLRAHRPEPTLIVTGPKEGRWRIGQRFGLEPVTLIVADLSMEEIRALADDPALTVIVVDPPY